MNERTANKFNKQIETNVTFFNTIKWFFISKLFSLKKLSKLSLGIIERWFTTVADSENFLELNFTLVAQILNSSELLIDSELQVFNVMNAWLNHKSVERSKHAKYLLQRVRLSLLTVPALNNILHKNLWIVMNDECSEIINKVIKNKKHLHSSRDKSINRYCSQNNFNVLVVGGIINKNQAVRSAYTIDINNLSVVKNLPQTKQKLLSLNSLYVFCIKGEIYVFGGYDFDDRTMPVEKYSPATKTWNVIAQMYDWRSYYCACSFIDSIYVLGGFLRGVIGGPSSCLVLNTINETWKEIAKLNVTRENASCVVFKGSIVVSGGSDGEELNTIEAYDHVDDSWSKMPNMIERRWLHSSVAIKNKLFLIGGSTNSNIEVFDLHCNQFVLPRCPNDLRYNEISDVTSVANKIVIFSNRNGLVLYYDVENDVWSEKHCDATQNIKCFYCSKIPKL